jgi:hypothetical protein
LDVVLCGHQIMVEIGELPLIAKQRCAPTPGDAREAVEASQEVIRGDMVLELEL